MVRNYAFAGVFTTQLAMLMGGANSKPLGEVITARFFETLFAATMAIIALWVITKAIEAHHMRRLIGRSYWSMGTLSAHY
ncbi:hypothetical protein ACDL65_04920 [Corynebacterium belfantii]|uniref:hypothetical protein n=2 Tax=Corynebacterium belfantii TaxID=2014537 RepID=UPI003530FD27